MNKIKHIQDDYQRYKQSTINQLVKEIQSQINKYDTSIIVESCFYTTSRFGIKYKDYKFHFYIGYESDGTLYLRGRKPYHKYCEEKEINKAYQYVRGVLLKALT